ncbi:MAG TPA: hypothetical protein VEI02_10665, partial [Planctomycetota bacterium]|nr:hypothetical protein [Planctomycetota bacterium]
AVALLNFHARDVAWWALVDGLRDGDDRVTTACVQTLQTLARDHARNVEWGPAAPSLRAVLSGTNLGAVAPLARALLATGVRADLGPDVVGGAGEGLLVFVPSARESFATPARDLLRRFTGDDQGIDVARWRARLATLKSKTAADSRPR